MGIMKGDVSKISGEVFVWNTKAEMITYSVKLVFAVCFPVPS